MLTELGPLILQEDGQGLLRNPYAWTTLAHLLVLESPAGVGFSYCYNMTLADPVADGDAGGCVNTDRSTARDARAAVQDFFHSKFPSLRYNPIYITGESYAGVYVPTLTKELLDHAKELPNIHGMAVGDPCTDNESQQQSMDMIWYAHKYGMITDDRFQMLYHRCNLRIPLVTTRGEHYGDHEKNLKVAETQREALLSEYRLQRQGQRNLKHQHHGDLHMLASPSECELEYRKFLLQTSSGISQEFAQQYINPFALYEPVDRNYDNALYTYMNREDVQKALHVESAPDTQWYDGVPDTNKVWEYYSEYAACNDNAASGVPSMVEFYRDLAPRLKTTIVFNGDADPCVSYEGTRKAVAKVGFQVIPGGDYRPWFYDATAASVEVIQNKPMSFGSMLSVHDGGRQYGGHVVNYEHNLSFVTVHGSGHMVPQIRPRPALHMLHYLLKGKLLSPLYLPDDVIKAMNETMFDEYVAHWTESARKG